MGLFNRKNSFKTLEEPNFKEPQAISGGNKFDVYNNLKTQRDIDISTIGEKRKGFISTIKNKLAEIGNRFINDKVIQWYYLLQLHGNYFCNTLQFESNNELFNSIMYKVIRCAWLYGKAGIYFDTAKKKVWGCYIIDIKYNLYGEVEYAKIGSVDIAIGNQDGKPLFNAWEELKGVDKCKNLAVFNWGTLALSSWVIFLPFVRSQHTLLKMLVGQAFSFNKKFLYKINNINVVGEELETFYNPENLFIIQLAEEELSNKFDTLEQKGGNVRDFIEYYKEYCGIWYHLLGRQVNLDNKKERNVSSEVEANQSNFSIVQRDYMNQFKTFIETINQMGDKLNLEGLQVKYIEVENDLQGTNTENEPEDNSNKRSTDL